MRDVSRLSVIASEAWQSMCNYFRWLSAAKRCIETTFVRSAIFSEDFYYFPWRPPSLRNIPGSGSTGFAATVEISEIEISALPVDRIRHSSRRPPVCSFRGRLRSLSGTSCALTPGIAPHCSQFRGRSLRFESCRPSFIF